MMLILQLAGSLLGGFLTSLVSTNAPLIIVLGLIMYFFASRLGALIIKILGITFIIIAVLSMAGINLLSIIGL